MIGDTAEGHVVEAEKLIQTLSQTKELAKLSTEEIKSMVQTAEENATTAKERLEEIIEGANNVEGQFELEELAEVKTDKIKRLRATCVFLRARLKKIDICIATSRSLAQ